MIHEWKLVFMESLCACGLHMNTCSIRDHSTSWTRCKQTTTKLSTVPRNVTCDLFSISFNFHLQLLNSVWVSVVHTVSEISPKEIIAGIQVRLTWWPGPPTTEALWKSIQENTATRHIHVWRPRRHSLYVGVHHPDGKGLCLHVLLPEWSEWLHFAVAKHAILHAVRQLAQCALSTRQENSWHSSIQ
jgi:hypothetical protein